MRLLSITIILLILSGCTSKSKPEDLDTIQQLKTQLEKCERSSNKLTEDLKEIKLNNDSLKRNWTKRRAINALDNSSWRINDSNILTYENVINDKYWKRGTYFESADTGEYLYNVKVYNFEHKSNFYFIGFKPIIKNGEDIIVNIYELDESKNLFIVDSFKLLDKAIDDVANDEEIYLNDFLIRQSENLIINNGFLYYFKEMDYPASGNTFYEIISKRKYYKYRIDSKKQPEFIDDFVLTNTIIQSESSNRGLINNQKNLLAENSSGYISFYSIPDWNLVYNDFYNPDRKYIPTSNLKQISFDFETHFFSDSYLDNNLGYSREQVDPDINDEVFFGGMCWHTRKPILFFDNYGIDTRCIWKANLDNKSIEKIVPEHDALQPYFFEIKNNEYLAYVEKNKIMICESPNNINNSSKR